MDKSEKILTLNNQFEATMLSQVLTDKGVPHALVPLGDSNFAGIEQMEYGWGYLEAPEEFTDEIMNCYGEVLKATPPGDDDMNVSENQKEI